MKANHFSKLLDGLVSDSEGEEIGQAILATHQSPILLAFINYTADLLISICQSLALYFSTVSEFRQRKREVISMESIKSPTCSRIEILVSKIPIFACIFEGRRV